MWTVVNVPVPLELLQDAMWAHHVLWKWSLSSVEFRCRNSERMAYHFHDILMAIIIKEMLSQKKLPNTK